MKKEEECERKKKKKMMKKPNSPNLVKGKKKGSKVAADSDRGTHI